MSDNELADTIQKEAAQHIPFDLADVNLDYQILSDDTGSPTMEVLLVAVRKKDSNYTNVTLDGRTHSAIVDHRCPRSSRIATNTTTSRPPIRWCLVDLAPAS